MENLPPLRQLQYLLALSQHKSFSRAAEACNVTQSTFSAGIAALENLLGHQLINRSTRTLSFTALGEDIVAKGKSVIHQASEIVSMAKRSGEGLAGPLRLGIIPTIAPYLLPDLLPALSRDWPQLELQLHEDLSSHLVEKMESGKLDVLILAFPFTTPHFKQLPVFSEDFVLATPKDMASTDAVHIEDLENMELLLLEEGHCLRSHALDACRTQSPTIRKTFSTTSLPTLIQMVGNGYGVTLLPEMAAKQGALPEGIHIRRFKAPAPTRDIGLVWRPGTLKDNDLKNMAATIKSCQKPL